MGMRPHEQQTLPAASDARRIVELVTGRRVAGIRRFLTGTGHYVYDIDFADTGPPLVARLTRPDRGAAFRGALYWHPLLREQGVPLPELLYAKPDAAVHGFPVMLLERLPGRDLGDVYTALTRAERVRLAREIGAFQRRVQAMPPGSGYGYARSYDDRALYSRWSDVVAAHLERSRGRINADGAVSGEFVERVAARLETYRAYFDSVLPAPFLDDTTTKNVIIDQSRLTGVVDVDFVCFGDIAQLLGLINMAVISLGGDTDYVRYLAEELKITRAQ